MYCAALSFIISFESSLKTAVAGLHRQSLWRKFAPQQRADMLWFKMRMWLWGPEWKSGPWNSWWELKDEPWKQTVELLFAELIAQCDGHAEIWHYGVTEDLKHHVVHYIFLLYTMTLFFQSCLKRPEEWPVHSQKSYQIRTEHYGAQNILCVYHVFKKISIVYTVHLTFLFSFFLHLFSEMSCVIAMTTILSLGQHLLPLRNQ